MKRWTRRLLILIFILFWLMIMVLPTVAFVLAMNGQIRLGGDGQRYWRLFMVQEAEAEGVGLERARPVDAPPDAPPNTQCTKVSVNYWIWAAQSGAGEGPSAEYCQCSDAATGQSADVVPPACLLP